MYVTNLVRPALSTTRMSLISETVQDNGSPASLAMQGIGLLWRCEVQDVTMVPIGILYCFNSLITQSNNC